MRRVIPIIGVARTCIHAVAYIAHGKSGIFIKVIPGALIRCTVTMKLIPVRIEENPSIKAAVSAKITLVEDSTL
jgi:hypothetical protein